MLLECIGLKKSKNKLNYKSIVLRQNNTVVDIYTYNLQKELIC